MKITVVGAGAVGGYFGGRWQEAGLDVTFLVRPGRAKQLRKTGLVIESPFGNATLAPRIATSVDDIPACDVVLLAVKNYHLDGVFDDLRALTQKGAYVLPLLNGVEHIERLQAVCGKEQVLGGVVQIIATLDEQGRVVHTNQLHHISFGPLQKEQQAVCEQFMDAVSASKGEVLLSGDVRVDLWSKYAFITAFSGVTSASRLTIDEVMRIDATSRLYSQVVAEMASLAKAQGTTLPATYQANMEASVRRMPQGATSSMHQDLRKGLPLEVESLQGAAVRMADKTGLALPVVGTLYGLLLPYADGAAGRS